MTSRTAARGYGALLQLLPPAFRARYAREMRRMFEEEWADANMVGRLITAVRAVRDITWTAFAVRISPDYLNASSDGSLHGGSMLTGFSSDVRAALRALRRRPGFTAIAVITVGLGIGASTAVFSVVDGTVLNALRLPDADRIVSFYGTFDRQAGVEFLVSSAEFTDIRTEMRSIDRMGGWTMRNATLDAQSGAPARTIDAAFTIGEVYELVGASVAVGRLPGPQDDVLGEQPVALLSHDLWLESFGGDASVVGRRSIRVGDTDALIIGVLAPDVELPGTPADVWRHFVLDPATWATNRSGHGTQAIARLRPGVDVAAAEAELKTLERNWGERYAGQHTFGPEAHRAHVALLGDRMLGGARRIAILLSTATALLLVLAAANVANLLLARGETRTAEVGVRLALGSTRARVARPVLVEGVTIGLAGGVLGVIIAALGLPALLRMAPGEFARNAIGIDARVVAFAGVVSILTGFLFTLAPAYSAARRDPATLLRASGRGRTGATRGLRLLVGGQIAVATVLLAGAGLLARSLAEMNAVDPGLNTDGRATVDISLPPANYQEGERIVGFYEELLGRLQAGQGTERTALVRHLPLRDDWRIENVVPEGGSDTELLGVNIQSASSGWLRTLGIPLVEGRDFESTDREGNPLVALVNRSAADALWPGESAVGKRVLGTFMRDAGLVTIVGVYDDIRSGGLTAAPSPEFVLPLAQSGRFAGWIASMTLVMETNAANHAALESARTAVRAIDPNVPVENASTMDDVLRNSTARERFLTTLLSVFAFLALVIAAVGVFGVVSFTVARQTREFAIRGALGARRTAILAQVLRTNASLAGAGALSGVLLTAVAAPALGAFLFNVPPRDMTVLASVFVMLVTVALAASLLPAIRATQVAPARVLQDGD